MALNKHLSNVTAYVLLFQALEGGGNINDLHAESGLGLQTIRKFVSVARRKKMVHIKAWDKDSMGRYTRPVYALGSGKDTQRPPQQTSTERSRKRYAREHLIKLQLLGSNGTKTGNAGASDRRAAFGKQAPQGADPQYQQAA